MKNPAYENGTDSVNTLSGSNVARKLEVCGSPCWYQWWQSTRILEYTDGVVV